MSTSREAFEAWASKEYGESRLKPDPSGRQTFFYMPTQAAWSAWQAAMQHAYADAAEVCKEAAARNTAGADSTDDNDDARCMRSAAWKLTICANVFEERAKEVSDH